MCLAQRLNNGSFRHRDSFIPTDRNYLWEERFESFRGYQNISALRLSENIADYFNGVVLQRLSSASNVYDGEMRFQLAFNVSIVWFLVFLLLCKGIRSLGQIVIGMAVFSFLGLSVVCIKFLTLLNFETIQDIFPATDWQDFFANSNSWSVAAQEAFLTWGMLGKDDGSCSNILINIFDPTSSFQVFQFTQCIVRLTRLNGWIFTCYGAKHFWLCF